MKSLNKRHLAVLGTVGAFGTIGASVALANAVTGPSSSAAPYLVRSQPGVVTKSLLTVGDTVGGYRMAGIPDGLGAYDNGDGTFTLLANHEIPNTEGVVRRHGAKGAFVSKWVVDKDTLEVKSGEDLIQSLNTYNSATASWAPAASALNRLCSATLGELAAFYDAGSGKGYEGRLFMNGEETSGGRAFAHGTDGTSYELPALGKTAFENVVPRNLAGPKTVVSATDDTTPGQVYVWVGDKQASGNRVQRAGLDTGTLYGIAVDGVTLEDENTGIGGAKRFSLAALPDQHGRSGAQLQADSTAAKVTEFLRPEDSAWDTQDPRVLWFVTTDKFGGHSRLWKATFDSAADPTSGGVIEAVLDGTEGQQMLDNITVDDRGNLLLQEDPGNNVYVARIWKYFPASDTLSEVAHFDEDRFAPGGSSFLTQDEESSGVIDASSILGDGWFLADAQSHRKLADPELVEDGQLFAIHVPAGRKR
jgi:hypothetical protein